MRGKRVTLTCAECGIEFTRKPSALSGDKDYFCSLACAGKAYKRKHAGTNSVHYNSADVPCAQCGVTLTRRSSRFSTRKNHFCSRKCWGIWKAANTAGENSPHYKRVTLTCHQCGAEFHTTPARVNPQWNFCTHKCYSVWRATGLDSQKLKINRHRRNARKRILPADFTLTDWQFALDYFGGRCAACGRPPGLWHVLSIDHWIPISSPDCTGTIPTNIIPLCHGIEGCNESKSNRPPEQWLVDKFGKKRARAILAKVQEFFSLVRQLT